MRRAILIFILLSSTVLLRAQTRIIHTVVALCDNSQNIAKVPAILGNGTDLNNNLYWGALYGLKTHFKKSEDWVQVESIKNPNPLILERIIFKCNFEDSYLIADAYIGTQIYKAINNFIDFNSGAFKENILIESEEFMIGGGADLLIYIGHNGMMDYEFKKEKFPQSVDNCERDAMVLACYSNNYFTEPFQESNTNFVLGTNGLLAPEAYILEKALSSWLRDLSNKRIETSAAEAYAEYQKISFKSACRIFSTSCY